MNLIIDSGNSGIKIAVYEDMELIALHRLHHDEINFINTLVESYNIQYGIISDTSGRIPVNQLRNFGQINWLAMKNDIPLPIIISYETPETLGTDRIAAAAGAFYYYGAESVTCVIIDMGTCITMDVLEYGNNFLGGNISPGIAMRLKAMHHFTGRLPLLLPELPLNIIGASTHTAMQNGAVRGACYEIDAFIGEIQQMYPRINVILTGGDASFFADFSKNKIFALSNLVLDGLNVILNYNVEKI